MEVSAVPHTSSDTIPHSSHIPPYHRKCQASNTSRITRSSLREHTTGNAGLALPVEMASSLSLETALQEVLSHLALVEVQSSEIVS